MSKLLLPLAAVLLLALPGTAMAGPQAQSASVACPGANKAPNQVSMRDMERITLCLLNRERRLRGLKPLKANKQLARASRRYSRAMANNNFFSHVSPRGGSMLTRVRKSGYLARARGYTVGENIAWGAGGYSTPLQTVRGWMNSPGHRANILRSSFREIGVGVAPGAPVRLRGALPAATYTTDFGTRM